jgi:long-chain acyl-CoA synthetase
MGRPIPASRFKVNTGPFVPPARRFLETAKRRGSAPAYFVRDAKGWTGTPWNIYRDEVRRAARALVALGVKPGDIVCIFGYNRPEWVIMDLATMMAGAAPAGIYFTSSSQDAAYIINHAQCEVLLAERQEHFDAVAKERARLNCLRHVVMMKGAPANDPLQMTWESFLAHGEDRFDEEVERRLQATQASDVGTLIYTSGTTGPPKAVQLSHGALAYNASLVPKIWKVSEKDRIISYLPLAHIAEQMITIHFQTVIGNAVYFARSILDLPQHLPEVRPNMLFGVPRVFEKMAFAVQQKLSAATGAKAKLAGWAMKTAQEWHRREGENLPRGPRIRLAKALASRLVHKKVKRAMGLDQARLVVSGAAPIAAETLRFLNGLDIPIRELWGLSETSGSGTVNLPGATRLGSVGRVTPGNEIKIMPDGEICLKCAANFMGYAKDPGATAKTLVDGWLHTGDIGRIDEDGFVYITGRKKDIIITSGGKNIAPANIELDLAHLPLIDAAVVCGERRSYLTALVTLNPDAVSRFAAGKGLTPSDPRLTEAMRAAIQAGIDEINARHARFEHIRRFAILTEPLSIESGELTPTMKIKRATVMKRHEDIIESLYAGEEAAAKG